MGFQKNRWGLEFQNPHGLYEPACFHLRFDENTTAAILQTCKTILGVSVTHLGHAAMVIAALRRSRPESQPSEDPLVCPLFFNGRQYLDLDGLNSGAYLPMCRAMGFIEFNDLNTMSLPKLANEGETYGALIHACHQARNSYQQIKHQSSVLTESFAGSEYLASAHNEDQDTQAAPIFINDGVAEQHLQQVYHDASRTHKVLTILGAEFQADADGPPIVIRTSTFRGQLMLSAEWLEACYRRDEIEDFVRDVYQLMKSII